MNRIAGIVAPKGKKLQFWLNILFLALCCVQLHAAIVINEVLYDPPSDDLGYEWIELYNNGSVNEQLEGAQILSGGASYSLQYTLPSFVLRPGRYLLIGGTNVANAQLVYNFSFQNGGSETDGIRYLSPDGSYTDTVIYDEPNTNLLQDDSNQAGISFAPDCPAGYSLSRVVDAFDTQACAVDFICEEDPSPGTANHVRCDYAIGLVELLYADGIADLTAWLVNNSHFSPWDNASFSIYQNSELYSLEIAPIPAHDSVLVQTSFACTEQLLFLNLAWPDDPDTANNSRTISPLGGFTNWVVINEFLADPDAGNQEWIELYSAIDLPSREGVCLKDASGNTTNFLWSGNTGTYVICSDKDLLLQRYPDCPSENVIEASSWASLNNNGDSLFLLSGDVVWDSVAYAGAEICKGISRERYVDEFQFLDKWRNSYAPAGGTPGQNNSNPPPMELPEMGNIRLSGSPCEPQNGESISITYLLPSNANRISCKVFDQRGSKLRILADYELVGESGILIWNGRTQNGSIVPRGLYYILWESQSENGGKIMRKQLSAVIKN